MWDTELMAKVNAPVVIDLYSILPFAVLFAAGELALYIYLLVGLISSCF